MANYESIWKNLKSQVTSKRDMHKRGTLAATMIEDMWGVVFYDHIIETMNNLENTMTSKNASISPTEVENLPFGTNITVHIITTDRDETYNGVVINHKIYYEDGKIDDCHLIAEYVYGNAAEVFVK